MNVSIISRNSPPKYSTPAIRQRPHCDVFTRSHLNSEVNRHKARLVLGWVTVWELLRVLLVSKFLLNIHLIAKQLAQAENGTRCNL